MQFSLTRQYVRDLETPFAKFMDMNDATTFIEAKLAVDESLKLQVIYRLFSNYTLVNEVNRWKLKPTQPGAYAEGESFIPKVLANAYQVTQIHLGTETIIAEFDNVLDAKIF